MSSLIAVDDYNKAKEYEEKYLKSKIDFVRKSNKEKAIKHYEIAANAGNEDAMYDLAIYYSYSGFLGYKKINEEIFRFDLPENKEKTLYWLKKAAELNHSKSIEDLVFIYTWKINDDQQNLYYLLKRYEVDGICEISSIINIYKKIDPKKGIEFINSYVNKHNIDLKSWQFSIELANLYKMTNQKEKMDQIYRLIVSNEKYERYNVSAYLYVANDDYSKGNYENALKYYKMCGSITKIKEMSKNNQAITSKEFFEYVKEKNYVLELSKCYLEGYGTDKNEKEGFALLKNHYDELCKRGAGMYLNASLLVPLAECYYFGKGTTYNLKEALKLFLVAEKKQDIVNYDILYANKG